MNGIRDFDAYCAENDIQPGEEPAAFAAFLNQQYGWDGEVKEVKVEKAYCATCRTYFMSSDVPPYGVIHRIDDGTHLHPITREVLQPWPDPPEHEHDASCALGNPQCPEFAQPSVLAKHDPHTPFWGPEDGNAARGVLFGLLFSLPFWAVIAFLCWVWPGWVR